MPHTKRAVLCLAMCILALIGGCANESASRDLSARGRLERLAERSRTNDAATNAPPPEGFPVDTLAPSEDPRARLALDAAIAEIGTPPDQSPETDIVPSPTPESVMHYITGRSRLISGDVQGALVELEAAAKADPNAPEPWRAIGKAQNRLGDRLSAAAAYRQALRLDPNHVESLMHVGIWSLQRRDAESAATHLIAARAASQNSRDSGIAYVLDFHLGQALLSLGYLQAGAELLASGLDLPASFDAPTQYQAELESLFRQRGDAWRTIGDAYVRLVNWPNALNAYSEATALPTLDPAGLLPRLVYASMQSGQPAHAALAVLDSLETGVDLSGDRLLPLIRYIGSYSNVGPLLTTAINDRRQSLSPDEQKRLASLYARAAAAALPPNQARRALRDWLAHHPADAGAVSDLFQLVGDDPDLMVAETVRLIEQAPLNEERYTNALLQHGAPIESLSISVESSDSPAEAMLAARLMERQGETEEAIASLKRVLGESGDSLASHAMTVLLIELLASQGDIDQANLAVMSLGSPSDDADRLLLARSLAVVGRFEEALDVLLPAVEPMADGEPNAFTTNELDALALATELSWRVSDAVAVERWAQRALEVDPAFEPAFRRLIDLYVRNGPLADADKLTDTVRRLRDANPSSRTLRWLRAQELVATGQYDQAERDLLSLAEEDPTEPVVNLLTTLWLRTGSAERAEAWLRSRLDSTPTSGVIPSALARLLASNGQAEEAVALLDDWLETQPRDDDAARQLETILRERLNRVEEADQRALARLERQPASLARAVELSEVLVRLGMTDRAAAELLEELNAASRIPTPLARPLTNAILLLGQEAIQDQAEIDPVIELFDLLNDIFPTLPPEVQQQHLNVLVKGDRPYEDVVAVLEQAIIQHRERRAETAYIAVVRFIIFERPELAVRVGEMLYGQVIDLEPRFFYAWHSAARTMLDHEAAMRIIRAIATNNMASEVLRLDSVQPTGDADRMNAELAMLTADRFSARDAPFADVVAMYELAREFDPDHETLNNNYGYYLTVQGQRLNDAETLIRRSLAVRDDDPFAMDSLGWVLYRQGVLYDERGPNGELIREGALTVLRRASSLPVNRSSAEVQDHYGDALWAAGRERDAMDRWKGAEGLLEEQIINLERQLNQIQGAQNERVQLAQQLLDQSRADLDAVRAKLAAASRGEPPDIVPTLRPVNQPASSP